MPDVSARIIAMKSVSVSASWNESFTCDIPTNSMCLEVDEYRVRLPRGNEMTQHIPHFAPRHIHYTLATGN